MRRLLRAAVLLLAIGGLAGCGSNDEVPPLTVPSIVGKRLDVAEAELNDLGIQWRTKPPRAGEPFAQDLWELCATRPKEGTEVAETRVVELIVAGKGRCRARRR